MTVGKARAELERRTVETIRDLEADLGERESPNSTVWQFDSKEGHHKS
jgi:hypothetical protein